MGQPDHAEPCKMSLGPPLQRRIGLSARILAVAGMACMFGHGITPSEAAPLPSEVIELPRGAVVTAEGDSLTYGMDATPEGGRPAINGAGLLRSTSPYPEALQTLLPACSIKNLGYPGDRSVDGLVRWQDVPPPQLALLMYGSNDALNNGMASSGRVNLDTFRFVFTELVERRRRAGAQVVVIIPPPIGNPGVDGLIAPFRKALYAIAARLEVPVVDSPEILRRVEPLWTTDGIHLSAAANRRLAQALASVIKCGP